MNIDIDTGAFRIFPYPPNGNSNIGGIDLVSNPERIEEIPELKDFPEKKELIRRVNDKDSAFMTFGCDNGFQDSLFCGYIEFSYREASRFQQSEGYQELFDSFENYVKTDPQTKDCVDSILRSLRLSVSLFSYPARGIQNGHKIGLYYVGKDRQCVGQLLKIFCEWLIRQK